MYVTPASGVGPAVERRVITVGGKSSGAPVARYDGTVPGKDNVAARFFIRYYGRGDDS